MRIEDYAKYIKAMQLAGEKLMEEARERGGYIPTPPSSFATQGCIPFYQKCLKPDLTTAQKMRAVKFILTLETAEEI